LNNQWQPIETATLSWSEGLPYSQLFEDIYFSAENGLAEAKYVFIDNNNLIERWKTLATEESPSFVIAETGFGTGLNFLLTWFFWLKYAPKTARLHYFSCEKFPLTKSDLKACLDLWPQLHDQAEQLIDDYPTLTPGFHPLQFAEGRINLTLMLGEASDCFKQLLVCGEEKLEQQLNLNRVDAWFLDGFAPSKNQAMWTVELFQTLALLSKTDASLTTYSVAAMVKNNLKSAGFVVQKRKGFGCKRSMLVAEFKGPPLENKKLRTTPWHVAAPKASYSKKAIVLGAGLAGCFTAHSLAKRGWEVHLLDENSEAGEGASGNRQAVLYPKLSAYSSPLTAFMLTAYLFASRFYQKLGPLCGEFSGILQLAFDEKERLAHEDLRSWLKAYPELAHHVNANESSTLAGIDLTKGGLFIPNSGWLDSKDLCQKLIKTAGISWFPNTPVTEISYQDDGWLAGNHSCEILVLANGYQARQFAQTDYLPLKPIRGQMTMLATTKESLELKIPICGDGHVLPPYQNSQALGASYHLGVANQDIDAADDEENLSRLAKLPISVPWSNEIKSSWAGVRCATTDYLPLVGPVPDVQVFKSRFDTLSTNAKRWISMPGAYLPGLFICAGFGSRGLATIPLSAEWLSSLINNEPSQIPQAMARSLAPSRFLFKEIIKR